MIDTNLQRLDGDAYLHMMIDIETAGVKPGCMVLQIGAATISIDGNSIENLFCVGASIMSNNAKGLTMASDTMDWWEKQDPALYKEVFGPDLLLDESLMKLIGYYLHMESKAAQLNRKLLVWSNPVTFDFTVLEAAMKACGHSIPWSYKNTMCYRTVRELFSKTVALQEWPTELSKHNALHDAIYQAEHLSKILNYSRLLSEGRLP